MASEPITSMNAVLQYSRAEERLNVLSSVAGVLLSVAGLVWMLFISISIDDPWRIVASSIYGISLITLFLSSALYHGRHASSRRHLFKLMDHLAIYILIAGTYTPFLLVAIRSRLGWWLFGIIWTLAVAGILSKIWLRHRYPRLSLVSYLLMGWLVVIAAPQIASSLGSNGIAWLIAGGVSYTVGVIFYAAKAMPFAHVIWHFFVLVGAACHFFAVVWHVLPAHQLALVGNAVSAII